MLYKFNTDADFYIGKTHHICQDYAAHGFLHDDWSPFIVLSDGCSSSQKTDIGARILTSSLIKAMGRLNANEPFAGEWCFSKMALEDANIACNILKLPQECLDATLLYAMMINDFECALTCFGDGVLVKIRNDDFIEIVKIEYPSGAPLYLNYSSDQERKRRFIEKYSSRRNITNYDIKNSSKGLITISEYCEDKDSPYTEFVPIRNYKCVALFSDGVLSFMKRMAGQTSVYNEPMNFIDIILEMLAFKSYNGEFVKRRIQKFRKYCEENNIFNIDDVSMAAIHIEKEEIPDIVA